ncbi:hypothetical protein R4172_04955 [Rhodococcus kroppenstedtii]|uniref:hypothetical protein n=1 Tax=Rhodococcoides kroppenstedtii TaxID=293050 RepID=UPI0029555BDA|nr:hypothetical protein [Rhodococcus kroppenstedtii]MDV7196909.1 hypothetical protein [Rhodococcus kroppenstedtii]
MAKLVLRDCVITVNGVDFSDHVSQVEVSLKKAAVDTTNFSGGGKEQTAGLKDDEFTVSFQQDFASASIDATLFNLYNSEVEFPVTVKPRAVAVSAQNPLYSATCILLEYQPLAGKVGDLSDTKVKFAAQRSGITRAIA